MLLVLVYYYYYYNQNQLLPTLLIVVVVVFGGIVIVEMRTLFTLCNYCHSDEQARATGTRWCGSLEAGWWLGGLWGATAHLVGNRGGLVGTHRGD